jgi:hypothetical protein
VNDIPEFVLQNPSPFAKRFYGLETE